VNALKGRAGSGNSFFLRKALVVFQFTTAIGLMIAALVAFRQLTFMRSRELGITIDKVVVLKAMNFDKETWSDAHGGYVVDSGLSDKSRCIQE
jgi:putative ABC transport system permease protein